MPQHWRLLPLLTSVALLSGCGLMRQDAPVFGFEQRQRLAEAVARQGDLDTAVAILRGGGDPTGSPTDAVRLAGGMVRIGLVEEGLALGHAALATPGVSTAAILEMARLAIHAGRTGDAAALYRQLLARDPGQPDATNGLGVTEAMQGRLAVAEQAFRSALEVRPGDTAAQRNLTLALDMQGKAPMASGPVVAAAPPRDPPRPGLFRRILLAGLDLLPRL